MADDFYVEYGVLNIAANPHTDRNVYPNLLRRVAGRYTNFYDQDWAAITAPERADLGLWTGRIMVWTELDPDAPAIDKEKLEEVSLEEAHIALPPEFGINGRTFNYVLRERDHKIFFEWRNDLGHYLAPKRFQRILDNLFFKINTDGQIEVMVSVQYEEDTLDRILKLPVLKWFEVHVEPPNADDNDDDAEIVLKELESYNAKSKHVKFEKKRGRSTLKLREQTLREARVAASGNGVVKAAGVGADKKSVKLSTDDYPVKIVKRFMDRASAIGAAIATARDAVIGRRRQ